MRNSITPIAHRFHPTTHDLNGTCLDCVAQTLDAKIKSPSWQKSLMLERLIIALNRPLAGVTVFHTESSQWNTQFIHSFLGKFIPWNYRNVYVLCSLLIGYSQSQCYLYLPIETF